MSLMFHHLGLFVRDLDTGRRHLEGLLPGGQFGAAITDPLLRVEVQFYTSLDGLRYELVAPYGDQDPVTPVLKTGQNILNHAGYTGADFDSEVSRLRQARCLPLGQPMPAVAFEGRRVVFFLTPLRFIVELIEAGCVR